MGSVETSKRTRLKPQDAFVKSRWCFLSLWLCKQKPPAPLLSSCAEQMSTLFAPVVRQQGWLAGCPQTKILTSTQSHQFLFVNSRSCIPQSSQGIGIFHPVHPVYRPISEISSSFRAHVQRFYCSGVMRNLPQLSTSGPPSPTQTNHSLTSSPKC